MKGLFLISFVLHICMVMLFLNSPISAANSDPGTKGINRNGDVNGNGNIDLADAIYILTYLFSDGPEPVEWTCPDDLLASQDALASCQADKSTLQSQFLTCQGNLEQLGTLLADCQQSLADALADKAELQTQLLDAQAENESLKAELLACKSELGECQSQLGLPATGQRKCYDTDGNKIDCNSSDWPGQDGFYQIGCPMANRFVDNGDGTITDNCTGLMWQQETADTDGNGSVSYNDELTWQNALKYCENLVFAGHDDWRLPNVRELQSIVDYGRYNPSINPVFICKSSSYWSSSTVESSTSEAWHVYFYNGSVNYSYSLKTYENSVRAVRGPLALLP